jgi:hypothetical protein
MLDDRRGQSSAFVKFIGSAMTRICVASNLARSRIQNHCPRTTCQVTALSNDALSLLVSKEVIIASPEFALGLATNALELISDGIWYIKAKKQSGAITNE